MRFVPLRSAVMLREAGRGDDIRETESQPGSEPEVVVPPRALHPACSDRFIRDTIAAIVAEVARDPDLEAKCAAALRSQVTGRC